LLQEHLHVVCDVHVAVRGVRSKRRLSVDLKRVQTSTGQHGCTRYAASWGMGEDRSPHCAPAAAAVLPECRVLIASPWRHCARGLVGVFMAWAV
jgi:hypothetical protein